jgi:hypothetical protein
MLREERLSTAILAELERELQDKRQRIKELEGRSAALARELEVIHSSRFWLVASRYWQLRRRLARWGRSEG